MLAEYWYVHDVYIENYLFADYSMMKLVVWENDFMNFNSFLAKIYDNFFGLLEMTDWRERSKRVIIARNK